MTRLIFVEFVVLIATAAFIYAWFRNPEGNWEPVVALLTLVSSGAAVDLIRRFRQRRAAGRFDSGGARIRHRESLRKQFVQEILKCRTENLRQDVIVRHVDRVDNYPDTDEAASGISSWFRVALVDTYERGIVLCLRIGGLVECDGGYRFRDYVNGEEADVNAWLMGDVPYDSIAEVNMDGDKYYYFPHIYCHFDHAGQPYARLWFCQKIDEPHGHPYFRHLADYDDVVANNIDDGTLDFC